MKKTNTIKILEAIYYPDLVSNTVLKQMVGAHYPKYIYHLRKLWIKIKKHKSTNFKGLSYYELNKVPSHIKWEWRTRLEVWKKSWIKRLFNF